MSPDPSRLLHEETNKIRAALSIEPWLLADSVCALADDEAEHQQASALVHDAYVERGLIAPSPRRLHLGVAGARPDLGVLVLSRRGAVVGTVALITERDGRLPADDLFPAQMLALRRRGRSFIEVGMLAVDGAARKTGAALVLSIAALRLTRQIGATDVVVAIHPAAEAYYRAAMMFERHGDVRAYPGLSAKAATILMHHDVNRFARRALADFGAAPSLANPYHLHFVVPLPLGDFSPAARARSAAARAAWLASCAHLARDAIA